MEGGGAAVERWIALDEWVSFVAGRAEFARSTVRRFSRWLSNPRIQPLRLYAALLRTALGEFPDGRLFVALELPASPR